MSAPPRIAPLPPSQRDERTEALLASLRGPDGGDMHLFATLARHPKLLKRWSAFGGTLLFGGTLPARDREVLILRTAANCGADYEWGHHLEIGRGVGLGDDEMAGLAADPALTSGPHDDLLVRAADQLHTTNTLDDATWQELAAHYDEAQLIELCMVVGQYHLVAFTLNALRIAPEDGIVGLPR